MDHFVYDNVLAAKQGSLQKLNDNEWVVTVGFRAVNIEGKAIRPSCAFTVDPSSTDAVQASVEYGDYFKSKLTISDYSFGEDMKYMQSFAFKMTFESGAEGDYHQPLMIRI